MDAKILREMGEWAALGLYEGQSLPYPRAFGLAYRRMYENMDVRVPPGRLTAPCEPMAGSADMLTDGVWQAMGMICNFTHHAGLAVSDFMVKKRKEEYPQHAAFIDGLAEDLRARLPYYGGYTHSNPDGRTVVHRGFNALVRELEEELARPDLPPCEVNYLLALRDYAEGVKAHYARIRGALERASRERGGAEGEKRGAVAAAFTGCFMEPSRTFLQGLLALRLVWMLDGCDSIGRFDQILGPLYEKDIDEGALDPAFARELLDELFLDFDRLNGWNLQLGGCTPEGRDGYNRLTAECLDCAARHKLRRPNVAFRITASTPEAGVLKALEAVSRGSGRPAFYNDEAYLTAMRKHLPELSAEDAADYGFGGCTETMIAGMSNVGSLEGSLDFARALERAVLGGVGAKDGEKRGPATGCFEDFRSFEEFVGALKTQIAYMTDEFVREDYALLEKRFASGDPKLYRSFFTRDCIKRRKSFESGGARYNWAVVSYYGLSNLADGLAAIKKCVYDEGSISPAELAEAMRADFKGYASVRRKLVDAPKYGNDIDGVDLPAAGVVRFAWERLLSYETPRGGRYVPSIILFATYADEGREVGATPDGRSAFAPLSDSVGATAGRDRFGPTALLNSVLKMPLGLAFGTPVLNLRFSKEIMRRENLPKVWALLKGYFDRGGLQVQISVLDSLAMLEAKKHPEEYADLIVRVGGYSEYFVRLSPALQDSVIERTEHG